MFVPYPKEWGFSWNSFAHQQPLRRHHLEEARWWCSLRTYVVNQRFLFSIVLWLLKPWRAAGVPLLFLYQKPLHESRPSVCERKNLLDLWRSRDYVWIGRVHRINKECSGVTDAIRCGFPGTSSFKMSTINTENGRRCSSEGGGGTQTPHNLSSTRPHSSGC